MSTKGPYRGGSQEESYLDSDGVIKNVHDRYGQALRVTDAISVIKSKYTHFRVTYNLQNQPTEVFYYRGTKPHTSSVGCISDVSGSLNNKYLLLRSAPDNKLYHIWINVDNTGVDPAPADSLPIEINISANDPGLVVAQSIVLTINSLFKDQFYATRIGTVAEIVTQGYGIIDNTVDFNTTFLITNESGEQETLTDLVIDYDSGDPIYEGQLLKGYTYDIYSGKFIQKVEVNVDNIDVNLDAADDSVAIGDGDGDTLEINSDGSINVNILPNSQVLNSYFYEVTGVANGVTQLLFTYVAAQPTYLQKIEFSGTNIAEYELTIDSATVDKKRTYFSGGLNGSFNFDQGLLVSIGQTIQLYVLHNRPDLGNFNTRLQLLQG